MNAWGMDGAALDRYITGNWGEDQFKPPLKESRSHKAGRMARINNKPRTSCRCRSVKTRNQWFSGWDEEDFDLSHSNPQEEKKE